ncbi:hypothetical protein SAY86_024520 [Trapa natans]|uniref:Uncharacterized protein n=1 Tax=Trapa natans TaxID=22666 RepID=A0AAN7M4I3_TRANT|nr:hypothetical protein SAY86_024520 [Trapa natans]
MAEFLPDLDDGELWVPSDIFVNDVVANNSCRNSRLSPRLFLSLDEFSRSFSSTLSQLPPRPYVDYSPLLGFGLSHNYFQCVCMHVPILASCMSLCVPFTLPLIASVFRVTVKQRYNQSNTVISPPKAAAAPCFGAVHHVCNHRSGSPSPKRHHLRHQALTPQVKGFLETRTRVFPERSQNQLVIPSRIHTGESSRRECGGTGVFLPRVVEYATSVPDFSRKQGAWNRLDNQISQQLSKQDEECHGQLPPEMILPHDWTY